MGRKSVEDEEGRLLNVPMNMMHVLKHEVAVHTFHGLLPLLGASATRIGGITNLTFDEERGYINSIRSDSQCSRVSEAIPLTQHDSITPKMRKERSTGNSSGGSRARKKISKRNEEIFQT
jgi:hypothetical protein